MFYLFRLVSNRLGKPDGRPTLTPQKDTRQRNVRDLLKQQQRLRI